MTSTRADLDAGAVLVEKALVSFRQKPSEVEIAKIVDDLLRHGEFLLADVAGHDGVAVALEDWHMLTTRGPEDSPLGNWTHARALARTVRSMHRALTEPS